MSESKNVFFIKEVQAIALCKADKKQQGVLIRGRKMTEKSVFEIYNLWQTADNRKRG